MGKIEKLYNLSVDQYNWLYLVHLNLDSDTSEYRVIDSILEREYYTEEEKQFLNSHRKSLNGEIKYSPPHTPIIPSTPSMPPIPKASWQNGKNGIYD